MTKENSIFRTLQIKSNILTKINNTKDILAFYIKDGNIDKFQEVFSKHRINIDEVDNDGNSFLNLAVQRDQYEISEFIIDCGADVNLQNVRYD